jgi:hypothetical protein
MSSTVCRNAFLSLFSCLVFAGCAQTGLIRAEIGEGAERKYEMTLYGHFSGTCLDIPSCMSTPAIDDTRRVLLDTDTGTVDASNLKVLRRGLPGQQSEEKGLKGQISLTSGLVEVNLKSCRQTATGHESCTDHPFNGKAVLTPRK